MVICPGTNISIAAGIVGSLCSIGDTDSWECNVVPHGRLWTGHIGMFLGTLVDDTITLVQSSFVVQHSDPRRMDWLGHVDLWECGMGVGGAGRTCGRALCP